MQSLARPLLVFCLIFALPGCSTINQRNAVFADLSDRPIAPAKWRKLAGVYSGPVRSTSVGIGTTGVTSENMRLEVYGTPEDPLVFLRMRMFATSAFSAYNERNESFTNIPEREFGVRARLTASSHAPDELLITLEPALVSPNRGGAMIIKFATDGSAEVDSVGHFQRRGIGSLNRVPFSEVRH